MEHPEQNFVLFNATIMDRWLFVHWVEDADTSMLDSNWIRQRKANIVKSFIEG